MRVVFLDIDGVLNYRQHNLKVGETARLDEMGQPDWWTAMFNRDCVTQLNRIVRETGAKVVLSSSWRKSFSVSDMQSMLEDKGFEGELIGATPDHGKRPCRGEEAQAWLSDHPEVESFVLIDDSLDMFPYSDRWVQTFYEGYGLTSELADKTIELLTE